MCRILLNTSEEGYLKATRVGVLGITVETSGEGMGL